MPDLTHLPAIHTASVLAAELGLALSTLALSALIVITLTWLTRRLRRGQRKAQGLFALNRRAPEPPHGVVDAWSRTPAGRRASQQPVDLTLTR